MDGVGQVGARTYVHIQPNMPQGKTKYINITTLFYIVCIYYTHTVVNCNRKIESFLRCFEQKLQFPGLKMEGFRHKKRIYKLSSEMRMYIESGSAAPDK